MRGSFVKALIESQDEAWKPALAQAETLKFPGPYLFIGSGTSYYLAQVAAAFGERFGLKVSARPTQDIILEPSIVLKDVSTVVIISRSGTTSEALWAMKQTRILGKNVVAVTCVASSSLALSADQCLVSPEGDDDTVVMIRSFSSMLLLLQASIQLTMNGTHHMDELSREFETVLEESKSIGKLFESSPPTRLYILGSGVRYGIAQEGALKAQEMSGQYAIAFHSLEFRHGPWGSVSADDAVVILGQSSMATHETNLASQLLQRTPNVIVVAQKSWQATGALPVKFIPLPSNLDDLGLGPLAEVPLQWFAWMWSIQVGRNPDVPNNITKVVELHYE